MMPSEGELDPPIHFNVGNLNVLSEKQFMLGLKSFVKYAKWNASCGSLQTWSGSPNLHVFIGNGSGQLSTPSSITSERFCSVSADFGFSQPFLQKVVAKVPIFEYRFDFPASADTTTPPSLEIAMFTFENDSFFCLLRYDLKERTSKNLKFLKAMDHLKGKSLLANDLAAWLKSNQAILQRHPLMILNVILQFIQHEAHQYMRWRLEYNSLESRLGVTRDGDSLKLGGYAEVEHDFTLLNADLAGLAKKLAETELSASTILEHAQAVQRLVKMCEEYEEINTPGQSQSAGWLVSEQKEEIQSTIICAELYLRNMKMAQDVLQSFAAVLYNRISK
jgi:hypothetical protein